MMDRPTWKHWPRGQRFRLSARGGEAETAYREGIVAARSTPAHSPSAEARSSFDQARAAWAARYGVLPGDGLFLGEMTHEPRTLDELIRLVESSGADRRESHEAVDRLAAAGLVEPLAPPSTPSVPGR